MEIMLRIAIYGENGLKWLRVVRDMTPLKSILVPQEGMSHDYLKPFSGLSEPSEMMDCKKPESRGSPDNMSIESLLHTAMYGERMDGNG